MAEEVIDAAENLGRAILDRTVAEVQNTLGDIIAKELDKKFAEFSKEQDKKFAEFSRKQDKKFAATNQKIDKLIAWTKNPTLSVSVNRSEESQSEEEVPQRGRKTNTRGKGGGPTKRAKK